MNKFLNGWDEILDKEFEQDYYKNLRGFLKNEYSEYIIYPDMHDIFNCFRLTPLEEVKILILGQDPYHGEGQAHGLCFSVKDGVVPPPSLKNIFKELKNDVSFKETGSGNLTVWAKQGVLLLNTVLTVRENQPRSHKNKGWEIFTDNIIKALNNRDKPVVFILWGSDARTKKSIITNKNHLILEACHPSPLSAHNFFGCRHFSSANEFLIQKGLQPINWQI